MTKTKFNVQIHKFGFQNTALLKMIGKHNGGQVPFSIPDFLSYQSHAAALDNCEKDFVIQKDEENENVFHVSEDGGKTHTLTVEEIEVHELVETGE